MKNISCTLCLTTSVDTDQSMCKRCGFCYSTLCSGSVSLCLLKIRNHTCRKIIVSGPVYTLVKLIINREVSLFWVNYQVENGHILKCCGTPRTHRLFYYYRYILGLFSWLSLTICATIAGRHFVVGKQTFLSDTVLRWQPLLADTLRQVTLRGNLWHGSTHSKLIL